MWAWVFGAVSVGLWFWAGRRGLDVMLRTGRSIEVSKVQQQVGEMYGTEAEMLERMDKEPNEPAPAIRYAMMAGENWPELKLRAAAVAKRFPHLLQGEAMLGRALWELGEKDEARKVTRRALRRYPREVQLNLFAVDQALDAGNHREVLRRTQTLRREHPEDVWAYLAEVRLLIERKKYMEAERVLNLADEYIPGNDRINDLWAQLHEHVELTKS
jgi:predicted Zn-dependent protease